MRTLQAWAALWHAGERRGGRFRSVPPEHESAGAPPARTRRHGILASPWTPRS